MALPLFLSMATLCAAQPADWLPRIAASNMLWAPSDTNVPASSMPMLGNGMLATTLCAPGGPSAFYLSGVYDGIVSNRAAIPGRLTAGCVPPPGVPADAALDVKRATYYRRSTLPPGTPGGCTLAATASCTSAAREVVVEQRFYAHRELASVFVMEVEVLAAAGGITNTQPAAAAPPFAMLLLQNGAPLEVSAQVNFSLVDIPAPVPFSVWAGWTQAGELNVSALRHGVAVLSSSLHAPPPSVAGLWPLEEGGVLTFYTVLRSTLETEAGSLVDAVQADYAIAASRALAGTLHASHVEEWAAALWSSGIEIAGRADVARAVNASLYAILSSLRVERVYSLSPGSLATDFYEGHAFWDCEIWSLPPLNLLFPDLAASLLQYRLRMLPGARAKAAANNYTAGQGGGSGAPAMYAWESATTGEEQAPAPWGVREIHISGDVAVALWAFWRSSQDGSSGWLAATAWPMLSGIADFWLARLAADNPGAPPGSALHIVDVMPPDEDADQVTDDLWTNAGAVMALRYAAAAGEVLGQPANRTAAWQDAASRITILFNASAVGPGIVPGGVHPEFQGYFNVTIKQADVVLVPLLLGFTHASMTPAARANDLVWYSRVTALDGPAMTWALHAVGWADLGRWPEAALNFNRSFATLQPPFGVWWEVPTGAGTHNFITAAGGFLQAASIGYSRLRINDTALSLAPALPEGATAQRLRGVAYLGARLDIAWDAAVLSVTRVPPPPPNAHPRSQRGRVLLPRYQDAEGLPAAQPELRSAPAAELLLVDAAGLQHVLLPGVPLALPVDGAGRAVVIVSAH